MFWVYASGRRLEESSLTCQRASSERARDSCEIIACISFGGVALTSLGVVKAGIMISTLRQIMQSRRLFAGREGV